MFVTSDKSEDEVKGAPEDKTRDPETILRSIRNQIAKSERVGSAIGKSHKSPRRKGLFVLLVLLLGGSAGLWWYLSSNTTSLAMKDQADTKNHDGNAVLQIVADISADQLWKDFRANEVKAKHDYEFKTIKVSGVIKSVASGRDGSYDVAFRASDVGETDLERKVFDQLHESQCNFANDKLEGILKLHAGELVSIVGVCSDFSRYQIKMTNCSIAR